MLIYFFIFFVFISAFLGSNKKYFSHLSYFIILFSFLIFPILVGINSDRADFGNYLQFFQDTPVSFFSYDFFNYAKAQHSEIGYNYLQAFIKFFWNSATIYFILFCFISFLFRYKHYSFFLSKSDVIIAFFIFLSHEFLRKDAVQIRNGMASAIVLYALLFLYQNKKIKYIFFVLLAASFHMAGLVALPLVFLSINNLKKFDKFLAIAFLFSLCVSIFFPVRKILLLFSGWGLLPSQVVVYLNISDFLVPIPFTHPILLKQLFITGFIFIKRKKLFDDFAIHYLYQIYVISSCYYLIFRDFQILAGRFGSLFYAVEAPMLILMINKSNKNVILKKYLLCCFYFIFLIINFLTYDFLGFKIEIY
ncbi:EpsG family protein [Treponema sp. OMZ 787]|uniref:EpsG family protein n=1 Tax=Treponema sp. OMZ 787 TaxID=2563669 RepID=UPI0020A316C3|nr:EpsG family protein [Treponema sp. OMZ 787]UTC61603.1 EpsG family protein [Treponema sp. OMZ 787]